LLALQLYERSSIVVVGVGVDEEGREFVQEHGHGVEVQRRMFCDV
jgi:hypothetical protein